MLIALGVLKKDGRRIISDRGGRKGRKLESPEPEETEALRAKLASKLKVVEDKRRKLLDAQFKCKIIATLLQRNKRLNFTNEQTIPFPFIGVCLTASDVKVNLGESRR